MLPVTHMFTNLVHLNLHQLHLKYARSIEGEKHTLIAISVNVPLKAASLSLGKSIQKHHHLFPTWIFYTDTDEAEPSCQLTIHDSFVDEPSCQLTIHESFIDEHFEVLQEKYLKILQTCTSPILFILSSATSRGFSDSKTGKTARTEESQSIVI
ncbi:hypothetical protein DEO72_LG3g931 [Vigna unguiculata]|uniref:Uncharacterized protein n=1 Tax=Vigna unguiculata TaxID=3917 RepID=A0A4D6LCT8_VIGUN|nr:hypothetical protein DEO72_LG3g931 [Vigna unguiculata]